MAIPSYNSGFYAPARGGVAAYPSLWRNCVGAWSPCLGQTGLMLRDLSGYGNHGVMTNMDAATDWVRIPSILAIDLDGSNDKVVPPITPSHNLTTAVAISAWIRPTTVSGWKAIVYKSNQFSTGGYHLGISPSATLSMGLRSSGWFTFSGSQVCVANRWQHVYGQIVGNTATVYLNGVSGGSGTLGASLISDNTTSVLIGENLGLAENFAGAIADVRLYSRPLPVRDVRRLAIAPYIAYELRLASSLKSSGVTFRRSLSTRIGSRSLN